MKIITILVFAFLVVSCSDTVARKPVSQNTSSYVNKSTIARNKELVAIDEKTINTFISQDTLNDYTASPSGFWYTYVQKDTLGKRTPNVGDLVLFQYDIQTINGEMLFTQEEIGNTISKIDQSNQELITGLREGLKLIREGETITFLFPSHKAYGYYGREDKVPSNTPIKSTVTLLEIKDQTKD